MLEEIRNMLSERKENPCEDLILSLGERGIALYGAGGTGYITSSILKSKGCILSCFIDDDKDKQGTYINGINVVPLEAIDCNSELNILICVPNPMNIYDKLIGLGYKHVQYFPVMLVEQGYYDTSLLQRDWDKVRKVYDLLADDYSKALFINILKHRVTMDFLYLNQFISQKQYFPTDIFTLNSDECFVDGGAYNGDTIIDFINATNNVFKYIYGFEPDIQNFSNLTKNTMSLGHERINLFNAGLYSRTGKTGFNSQGNSGSSISSNGNDEISLIKLDEAVGEHIPTYIKLDIEGAEAEALYGMKNILMTSKPKLAISIYHKAADLWELPLIIHGMSPSYKIYMRHYTNGLNETVCYAI